MSETPQQCAKRLMDEIEACKQGTYTKGEVKTLLNHIFMIRPADGRPQGVPESWDADGCRSPARVTSLQRGDVFIAKTVGGKVRPWIVLRVQDEVVSAVAMSSGDKAPRMIQSKCRLWPGGWIGATITLFDVEVAVSEVTRPYTNFAHLAEIEAAVASNHGFRLAKPKMTMGDLVQRHMKAKRA